MGRCYVARNELEMLSLFVILSLFQQRANDVRLSERNDARIVPVTHCNGNPRFDIHAFYNEPSSRRSSESSLFLDVFSSNSSTTSSIIVLDCHCT